MVVAKFFLEVYNSLNTALSHLSVEMPSLSVAVVTSNIFYCRTWKWILLHLLFEVVHCTTPWSNTHALSFFVFDFYFLSYICDLFLFVLFTAWGRFLPLAWASSRSSSWSKLINSFFLWLMLRIASIKYTLPKNILQVIMGFFVPCLGILLWMSHCGASWSVVTGNFLTLL